ncbi:UNVERIFIED_CONTAM: Retrovirus-related Pol polyprotein from transposon TNT 1-94 [Sesamum indicum]
MDPLPSMGRAYSMVLQVEKQRKVNAKSLEFDKEEVMAVQTTHTRRQNGFKNPIKKRSAAKKKQMYCTYCKRSGHIREQCFELNGYPEWYKELMKQRKGANKPVINKTFNAQLENGKGNIQASSQNENNLSELIKVEVRKILHNPEFSQSYSNSMYADNSVYFAGTLLHKTSFKSKEDWIMDSGASTHMSMNHDLFHNLRHLDNINSVKLPDASMYKVEKIGDICISDKLTLKNVLYIPYFKHNMFSVNALCEAGNINVIFTNSQCFVQDLVTKKVVAISIKRGRLYLLEHTQNCKKHDLHKHIAHLTEDLKYLIREKKHADIWHNRLGHLSKDVMFHLPFKIDRNEPLTCCEVCPLAKQHRLPFQLNENHSSTVFDLIHIDVWGPCNQYSVTNCIYMLTIIDDCSRATWIYMMVHKSQVQQKLEYFLNMVETQFNLKKFWVESLLSATYLINRIPTPTLKWKSPYEILHNKAPDFTHLKVFGCLCFATNILPHKGKFEPRAMRCVSLGYAQGKKGYKVLDLDTNMMHIARDVVFHEKNLPFKTMKPEDNSCPLPTVEYEQNDEDTRQLEQEVTPQEDVSRLRRSTRTTHRPMWRKFILCRPKCFSEAQKRLEWRNAMKQEIDALEKNITWELCALPEVKKPIGCKWVFKIKLRSNGSVERHKARLVAKGFNQVEGEDYSDCFAPVAKIVTVRTFLGPAVAKGWHLHHLDVDNAFLHGTLDETIYMRPPEGYEVGEEMVCKLKKSLYGLKQASRQWNTTKELIEEVKKYLDNLFTIKDLGEAQYFLGLEFFRTQKGLVLSQKKYTQDIIRDIGLLEGKLVATPLPSGLNFSLEPDRPLKDASRYRRFIGRLLYLGFTRPDICFATQQLRQFVQEPC